MLIPKATKTSLTRLVRARLDGTEEGRRLYDEIAGGCIDWMSFRFTICERSYDAGEHLGTVRKVKRLYDVAAWIFGCGGSRRRLR